MNQTKWLVVAALLVVLLPLPRAVGQIGNWNVDANGNWSSTTNWLGGSLPGFGGVAKFGESFGQSADRIVTNDANPTLSGVHFDTSFSYTVGTTSSNISMNSATAFEIRSIRSRDGVFQAGFNTINSNLVGSASVFNKTGNGRIILGGLNTFTAVGGVRVTGGELRMESGDAALGNLSNSLHINGGTIDTGNSWWITQRNISIGSNGATFIPNRHISLRGALTGDSQLTISRGSALYKFSILGNAMGFTGPIRLESGVMTLAENGAIGGNAAFDIAGTLELNGPNGVPNRISDNRPVTLRGSLMALYSEPNGAFESVGDLVLANGGSTISVQKGVEAPANSVSTLSFAGIQRMNRATVFFRGDNLGGPGGTATCHILLRSSPGALVGGGAALNATNKNISVLPFASGSVSSFATTGDLVSWDASTGRIFVLGETNYATLALASATENVNVQSVTSVIQGGQTINALKLGSTLNGGQADVLTVTSGAIVANAAAIVNAPLNFGDAEGILHAHAATTINGRISGTNGFNKTGIGALTLRGNSNYTGITTINGGQVLVNGTVNPGVSGVFGSDSSDIVLNSNSVAEGGSSQTRIWVDGNVTTTFNRGFSVNAGGNTPVGLGSVGGTSKLVVNGNIQINDPHGSESNGQLRLEGKNNPGGVAAVEINGVISGNGGVRSTGSSWNILNGNNTYSGGTDLGGGNWHLGHNNALGTGKIWNGGTISASGGPRAIGNEFEITFVNFAGTEPLTLTGGLFLVGSQVSVSVTTTNGVTCDGSVRGASLLKLGDGNLTLANPLNSYIGSTTVRNGTITLAGDASIGAGVLGTNPNTALGSSATVALGDTLTTATNHLALVTKGPYTIERPIQVNGRNTSGTSTVGGINNVGNSNFNGQINLSRAVTQLTAATGGSTTFNGQITQSAAVAGINKIGEGRVILTNNNSYSGGTTVSSGTLLVNNSTGFGTGLGSVLVNASGTLGGTGAIAGAVTVHGSLSPGASIESLVSGALTLNSTSTFVWEAVNNTVTGADLMQVNGTLTLNGGRLDLGLANLSSSTWSIGDKLTLISYGGSAITAGFAGYQDDTAYQFGWNEWTINYNDTVRGSNYGSDAASTNFITLTLTAVPEPASSLLVVTSAILLTFGHRRRRQS